MNAENAEHQKEKQKEQLVSAAYCIMPRKEVAVRDWVCRPAEIYEKINIVGKGTFG